MFAILDVCMFALFLMFGCWDFRVFAFLDVWMFAEHFEYKLMG